ncbi:hypothetical protein AB0K09_02510 [Streptomyces sp. NPDC049577]
MTGHESVYDPLPDVVDLTGETPSPAAEPEVYLEPHYCSHDDSSGEGGA